MGYVGLSSYYRTTISIISATMFPRIAQGLRKVTFCGVMFVSDRRQRGRETCKSRGTRTQVTAITLTIAVMGSTHMGQPRTPADIKHV